MRVYPAGGDVKGSPKIVIKFRYLDFNWQLEEVGTLVINKSEYFPGSNLGILTCLKTFDTVSVAYPHQIRPIWFRYSLTSRYAMSP
jgi:hypothetical protein